MAGNRFEELKRPCLEDGVVDPVVAREKKMLVKERVAGVLQRRQLKRDIKRERVERERQGAVPF